MRQINRNNTHIKEKKTKSTDLRAKQNFVQHEVKQLGSSIYINILIFFVVLIYPKTCIKQTRLSLLRFRFLSLSHSPSSIVLYMFVCLFICLLKSNKSLRLIIVIFFVLFILIRVNLCLLISYYKFKLRSSWTEKTQYRFSSFLNTFAEIAFICSFYHCEWREERNKICNIVVLSQTVARSGGNKAKKI